MALGIKGTDWQASLLGYVMKRVSELKSEDLDPYLCFMLLASLSFSFLCRLGIIILPLRPVMKMIHMKVCCKLLFYRQVNYYRCNWRWSMVILSGYRLLSTVLYNLFSPGGGYNGIADWGRVTLQDIITQALWMCRVGGEYNCKLECGAIRVTSQVYMDSRESFRLSTSL